MGIQKEPAMSVFSRAAILILLVGHLCYADEEFTDIADKEFDGLRNWNGRKTKQLDDGPTLLVRGIGVEDWVLVRHVSSSAGTWHPAVDHLTGTEKYGNPSDPKSTFSIAFKTMQYSQVLLTLGDFSKWMLFDKSELDKCTNLGISSGIKVRASSANGAPHKNTGTLLCRPSQSEDPWIYLTGKSGNSDIVYGGKSYSGSHAAHLSSHGGASVYIRTTSRASVPESLKIHSSCNSSGLCQDSVACSGKCAKCSLGQYCALDPTGWRTRNECVCRSPDGSVWSGGQWKVCFGRIAGSLHVAWSENPTYEACRTCNTAGMHGGSVSGRMMCTSCFPSGSYNAATLDVADTGNALLSWLGTVGTLASIVQSQARHQRTSPSGWVLVRHVSSSAGTWHPAVDHLTGTEKYGNPSDPKSTFSIAFKTMQYSQVLLTLGDFSKWMLFDKSELDKCTTSGISSGIKVRASSANGAPHKNTGTLLCRPGQSEDPWIYLTGKGGNSDIVYGGKSYGGSHAAHLSS